jgi:hypothetical protein
MNNFYYNKYLSIEKKNINKIIDSCLKELVEILKIAEFDISQLKENNINLFLKINSKQEDNLISNFGNFDKINEKEEKKLYLKNNHDKNNENQIFFNNNIIEDDSDILISSKKIINDKELIEHVLFTKNTQISFENNENNSQISLCNKNQIIFYLNYISKKKKI